MSKQGSLNDSSGIDKKSNYSFDDQFDNSGEKKKSRNSSLNEQNLLDENIGKDDG